MSLKFDFTPSAAKLMPLPLGRCPFHPVLHLPQNLLQSSGPCEVPLGTAELSPSGTSTPFSSTWLYRLWSSHRGAAEMPRMPGLLGIAEETLQTGGSASSRAVRNTARTGAELFLPTTARFGAGRGAVPRRACRAAQLLCSSSRCPWTHEFALRCNQWASWA